MLTKSVFPQQRLCQLLRERSVERGDFVLASGRRSSFYIDARRTTMSGEGLALVGPLALERFAARGWEPRFVGGLTLGADPVAYAIAAAARQDRKSTRLNSSHDQISYAVFCLKKKKNKTSYTHRAHRHHHTYNH